MRVLAQLRGLHHLGFLALTRFLKYKQMYTCEEAPVAGEAIHSRLARSVATSSEVNSRLHPLVEDRKG